MGAVSEMDRAVNPAYLQDQYGTTERLRIRLATHQQYSERQDDFVGWMLDQLEPRAGDRVLDVGCGTGVYHAALVARGVRVIAAVDASPAMVEATQRQAEEQGWPVVTLRGEAQALPLPDRAYDVGMANHMLFHVPDQRAALRELRRVLKPGGRVLLATNAADHAARLRSLHEQAARAHGWVPSASPGDRFNLDNDEHLALVQEAFPFAERRVRHDAFVFPTVDAVLRLYASGPIDAIEDRPADGSHRPPLLAHVGEQVERIITQEGVLRVPKDAGCFVAEVPRD